MTENHIHASSPLRSAVLGLRLLWRRQACDEPSEGLSAPGAAPAGPVRKTSSLKATSGLKPNRKVPVTATQGALGLPYWTERELKLSMCLRSALSYLAYNLKGPTGRNRTSKRLPASLWEVFSSSLCSRWREKGVIALYGYHYCSQCFTLFSIYPQTTRQRHA